MVMVADDGAAHNFSKFASNFVRKIFYMRSLYTFLYFDTHTHTHTHSHREAQSIRQSLHIATTGRLKLHTTSLNSPFRLTGCCIHRYHMCIYTHKELKPHPKDSSLLYVLYKSGSLVNVRNSLRGLAKWRGSESRVCNKKINKSSKQR